MEWKNLLCHIGFLMLMNMMQNKAFVLGVGLIQNEFWFTCTLFWYKSQFCSSNNGRNSGLNFSTDDYNKEKSAIFTSAGDIFVNCLAVSFSQTVLFALVLRWFSHARWKKHPLATRVKKSLVAQWLNRIFLLLNARSCGDRLVAQRLSVHLVLWVTIV